MSAASFSGERGLALRGAELTDVFLELFAVTRWKELDFLLIDMPPGLGDEVLDLIRYVRRAEALLVTTPSVVSAKVVARLHRLLEERGVPVLGLIENMTGRGGSYRGERDAPPRPAADTSGGELAPLAAVPFSTELETAVGRPEALVETDFARALRPVLRFLTGSHPSAADGR
jgi:ATP-binding protein involved in chromosome partitioning